MSCAGGDATGGDVVDAPVPGTIGWPKFLKKGLRVPVSACGELMFEVLVVAAGGDAAVTVGSAGGDTCFSMALGGVAAWGVRSCGPSSSDELSLSIASS